MGIFNSEVLKISEIARLQYEKGIINIEEYNFIMLTLFRKMKAANYSQKVFEEINLKLKQPIENINLSDLIEVLLAVN